MSFALCSERPDSFLSLQSFVGCSFVIHQLLARLNNTLSEKLPLPSPSVEESDRASEELRSWESQFSDTIVRHLEDVFRPLWIAGALHDPASGRMMVRSSRGFEAPRMGGCLPDGPWAEGSKRSAAVWPLQGTPTPPGPLPERLGEVFPMTRFLLSILALDLQGDPAAMLLLGFGEGRTTPSSTEIERIEGAAEHIGAALGAYRNVAKRLGKIHRLESNRKIQPTAQSQASAAPGRESLLAVSMVPQGYPVAAAERDYCAMAGCRTGSARLVVARLVTQGPERAWEALALETAFRASCALCKPPCEVLDLMSSIWPGVNGGVGVVRQVSCADVAESGREYVFSSSATHLLYESASQTVVELFEHLPDESEPEGRRQGQCVRLHSGDMIILHTHDLPSALPKRHDVLRRLAATLARGGRRPVAELAGQIAATLGSGPGGQSVEPALILLRAE